MLLNVKLKSWWIPGHLVSISTGQVQRTLESNKGLHGVSVESEGHLPPETNLPELPHSALLSPQLHFTCSALDFSLLLPIALNLVPLNSLSPLFGQGPSRTPRTDCLFVLMVNLSSFFFQITSLCFSPVSRTPNLN